MHNCTRLITTVPASPPSNVVADSPTSTSINVSWEEVPPIDQNGIIITYEVCYEPLETFGGTIRKRMVNTSELFVALAELEEFVEYNLSVRAYTNQGSGPFSDDITQTTQEDGTFVYWYYYPNSVLHGNFSSVPKCSYSIFNFVH